MLKQAVAAELFSAAWCNLDCTYCYIPKHNEKIKEKHQTIIRELKEVYPLIERLKKIYGENLQILSHWGAEPSLTIEHFKDFYVQAVKEFPNLNTISFSSNFLQNTQKVADFIKEFPQDRKFEFDVQMSLDGPTWITDQNRRGGATQKIIDNMYYFVELLNQENQFHTIKTHFKPTVSRHQFKELIKGDTFYNYYLFWDEVCFYLRQKNRNRQVNMAFNCSPTIVCPDEYSQQDGKNFNELCIQTNQLKDKFKVIKPEFGYYQAFFKLGYLINEFFTKQKMFTCSAGDSQFGISEYLHPCHDTFYHPYDEIKDAFFTDSDRIHSSNEVKNIESGRFDVTRDTLVRDIDSSDKELQKYNYELRAFHDFSSFKCSYGYAITKELANAGLISSCYNNDDMAFLLSAYVNTRHSCPTGNVQYSGCKHLNPISYFKLFGNGLVENFLKQYIEEEL